MLDNQSFIDDLDNPQIKTMEESREYLRINPGSRTQTALQYLLEQVNTGDMDLDIYTAKYQDEESGERRTVKPRNRTDETEQERRRKKEVEEKPISKAIGRHLNLSTILIKKMASYVRKNTAQEENQLFDLTAVGSYVPGLISNFVKKQTGMPTAPFTIFHPFNCGNLAAALISAKWFW